VPDLRTILRSFGPTHALQNAERELLEHERIHVEIDALARRLAAARARRAYCEPEDGSAA
jgi:hypothetical protein